MPDVVVAKRRRRTVENAEQSIQPLLDERRNAVRRGDFEILGRMARAETPHGLMQWPHDSGPILAYLGERDKNNAFVNLSKNKLAIVTAWEGLPQIRKSTEEPCPDCLRECDVCQGQGKKLCEAYGCGGSGVGPAIGLVLCPAKGCSKETGHFEKNCQQCKGSGQVEVREACKVCRGETIPGLVGTVATCSMCKGRKTYATGIKDGETNYRLPACLACGGSKFKGEVVDQDVNKFVNAWIGNMAVVGPITRFSTESVAGEGLPPLVFDVDPDVNGDLLVLIVDQQSEPRSAFLIGGVIKARS